VLSELGHIPVVGECVDVVGARVCVEVVRRRRIARLRVTATAVAADEGETGRGSGRDAQ
jgi:CBS domain containing-hemolysin-like protein